MNMLKKKLNSHEHMQYQTNFWRNLQANSVSLVSCPVPPASDSIKNVKMLKNISI